ncbi:hypothetical protein CDSM653_02399 [Caldanaerobacter subterraneus subsp. pacificus DSM 12653]|uniref:Uncharacterized protein n=1 Tax=Caldanaerobacter subterraneus subsp. pacificus DSM 12653 TaxID=391606 RepID=A0A0F5PJ07_9THEO|nr:hypothetical protein CDSM653_02399 [Caldanaerobacter subterraneus subsp. pacificus DSM 12653]
MYVVDDFSLFLFLAYLRGIETTIPLGKQDGILIVFSLPKRD